MARGNPIRKGPHRPVFLVVRRLVDPDTGETVGAFVPNGPEALEECRSRGMIAGSRWKGMLTQDRNSTFWRYAHRLGMWLAKHHEQYHHLGAHEAIKKLQTDSEIGCTVTRTDVFNNDGTRCFTLKHRQPLSLAFDMMDEGEFRSYWDGGQEARGNGGWIGWMRHHLYPDMAAPTVEELEFFITGERDLWREK